MSGEKNYTIEELSAMIVDTVLEEKILNRQTLLPRVQALVKTMVDLKNVPKNYNAYESKTTAARRLRTIEQKDCELKFWLALVKKMDPDNMEHYYKQSLDHLIEKGFRFPPKSE